MNIDITNIRGSFQKKGYSSSDGRIFDIVRQFMVNRKYDTTNYDNNLKTLVIESYANQSPTYIASKNKIVGVRLQEPKLLAHELFHMASNSPNNTSSHGARFENNMGEFLDEGLTESFMSEIVMEYKTRYPMELLFVEYLRDLYYDDQYKFLNAYFKDNQSEFYNSFGDAKKVIMTNMPALDKFTKYRLKYFGMVTMYEGTAKEKIRQELEDEKDGVLTGFINAMSNICKFLYEKDEDLTSDYIEEFKDNFKYFWENDPDVDKYLELFDSNLGIGGKKK